MGQRRQLQGARDRKRLSGVVPAVLVVAALLGIVALFNTVTGWPSASVSDLGLTEADCRCCHAQGVPDRHHLLVETESFECFDCHEIIWDEATQTYKPVVTRDCLVCHTGSLADRHHILTQHADYECLTCHAVVWDPDTGSYFVTFANDCQPTNPQIENCTDGIDNDGDGLIDCMDTYCTGTPDCLPQAELCTDGNDNDGDGLTDCQDPECTAAPDCTAGEICTDGVDNDGDDLVDCEDPDCTGVSGCPGNQVEECADGVDNDGDGQVDCDDPDCAAAPICAPPVPEECTDGVDNDGDSLIDCSDPDCSGTLQCPPDPDPTDHHALHRGPSNDCTGCHLTNLHDEHDERCEICHQSANPAVLGAIATGDKDCLACHSATVHSMGCVNCHGTDKPKGNKRTPNVHLGHMVSTNCGVCHEIPETPNLEPTGQYCATCHDSPKPYEHASLPTIHRLHATSQAYVPYACYMCHGQAIPQTWPEQCDVCHTDRIYTSAQLPLIHQTHSNRFDCTNCHFDPRDFALADSSTSCLRCHEMRSYPSSYDLHFLHVDKQCWACHVSNGVSARSGHPCESCHDGPVSYSDQQQVHNGHAANGNQCAVCHVTVVPKFPSISRPAGVPSGTITGTVTNSGGGGLEHVTVSCMDGQFWTLTAPDGTYQLDYVRAGDHTLIASKAGYGEESQPVTVVVGRTDTADFTLSPLPNTGTISGTVKHADGTTIFGANVYTDLDDYVDTTTADGSYTLYPVVQGTYAVTAEKSGYDSQVQTATVDPGQTSTVDFTLTVPGQEVCTDGVDNDGDRLIDCGDPDCDSQCTQCTDGDNDGFSPDGGTCGPVDCDDQNLAVNPEATEVCTDGLDNDCDGLADCDDSICKRERVCKKK